MNPFFRPSKTYLIWYWSLDSIDFEEFEKEADAERFVTGLIADPTVSGWILYHAAKSGEKLI